MTPSIVAMMTHEIPEMKDRAPLGHPHPSHLGQVITVVMHSPIFGVPGLTHQFMGADNFLIVRKSDSITSMKAHSHRLEEVTFEPKAAESYGSGCLGFISLSVP